MFDKSYCINLSHRTDRWEHFQKEKEFLGFDVSRFDAVNGKECGLLPGSPPYPGWTTISLGNLGDVLSHRSIIFKSLKDNINSVLILEDDVEFDKSINLQEYLHTIPNDWDMIYFGGAHREPLIPINEHWGQCVFTLTTHAVALKKNIFTKALDITSGLAAPIDLYYAMIQRYYKVYAPPKPLAWQIDGYSDIEDKNVEYGHLR